MFQGVSKTLSSNREKLEDQYSSESEVGSKKQTRYFDLNKYVLNFLTEQMRLVAPGFSRRPYLIIVADAADAVSVSFFGRCKFLQI